MKNLTSEQAEILLSLIKQRESIDAEIEKLVQTSEGYPIAESRGQSKLHVEARESTHRRKLAKGGSIQEGILKCLSEAGEEGIKVADIATALNKTRTHIHNWFSQTGREIPSIKKIGPGRYVIDRGEQPLARKPAASKAQAAGVFA